MKSSHGLQEFKRLIGTHYEGILILKMYLFNMCCIIVKVLIRGHILIYININFLKSEIVETGELTLKIVILSDNSLSLEGQRIPLHLQKFGFIKLVDKG